MRLLTPAVLARQRQNPLKKRLPQARRRAETAVRPPRREPPTDGTRRRSPVRPHTLVIKNGVRYPSDFGVRRCFNFTLRVFSFVIRASKWQTNGAFGYLGVPAAKNGQTTALICYFGGASGDKFGCKPPTNARAQASR